MSLFLDVTLEQSPPLSVAKNNTPLLSTSPSISLQLELDLCVHLSLDSIFWPVRSTGAYRQVRWRCVASMKRKTSAKSNAPWCNYKYSRAHVARASGMPRTLIQELIDQFDHPNPSASVRLEHFHSVPVYPMWKLKVTRSNNVAVRCFISLDSSEWCGAHLHDPRSDE